MTTSGNSGSRPYRNEIDALRERKETLEREIAQLKEQTTQLEGLRSREEELERELAGVAHKLGASQQRRRALPMLDQVKVASPCNASWDEMLGDERVRFCVSCEKNVYNLSAMPREEGERLLEERLGNDLCIRFYQRADGTIMTQDCPVGVKKKQRKKLAIAVAGAGAMALAATTMLTRGSTCRMGEMESVQGKIAEPMPVPVMGEPAIVDPPAPAPTVIPDDEGWMTGQKVATPPTTTTATPAKPPPPPPPPPPTHVMGRRAR